MRSDRSADPERVVWLDPGSWFRITEPRKGCSFEAADILLGEIDDVKRGPALVAAHLLDVAPPRGSAGVAAHADPDQLAFVSSQGRAGEGEHVVVDQRTS